MPRDLLATTNQPNTYDESAIRQQGASKRSEGVGANGMLPGGQGNLDRKAAGDNWSTYGISENGNNTTVVLPTMPGDKPSNDETGFLGTAVERYQKDRKHYGKFETDDAGAAFMRGATAKQPRDLLAEAPRDQGVTPTAALASPSMMDRLRTSPLGAAGQTLLRAGQGVEQLAVHGIASAADLGGYAPNPVADALHGVAANVDTAIAGQNQGYEDAGARVDAASTDPRLSIALRKTGETMGNMVNPAGMAGNVIEAAPTIMNAAVRGATSGAGFAASQPVTGTANYWTEKAKQVGTGGLTGAVTGAAAEKLGQVKPTAPPSSTVFKGLASDAYDASKATGATVPKSGFEAAIANAETKARSTVTYRPPLQPRAATAIDQIRQDLSDAGPNVTFEDMDVARRIARTVLTSPDKNERAVAHTIIDGIDDYVASLNSKEGDALTTARDLFTRGSKLDTIERLVTKAEDKIGAGQTQTKYDNAIRQQFKSLKGNRAGFSQFTPEEQAAITQIVRGSRVQNIARNIGRLSPTQTIPIVSELAAVGNAIARGSEMEALGVVGAAGAGLFGQHVADTMSAQNVNGLRILVARGPQRLAVPTPRPTPNALIRNSLATFAAQSLLQPRSQ